MVNAIARAGSDASLTVLAREFAGAQRRFGRMLAEASRLYGLRFPAEVERAEEQSGDRLNEIAARMADVPARSPRALGAKAAVLKIALAGHGDDADSRLLFSLLDDLADGAAR